MNASTSSAIAGSSTSDLWSDILKSADRQKSSNPGKKNIVLLSERHHGRRYLLDQLLKGSTTASAAALKDKRKAGNDDSQKAGRKRTLAMGYEVLQSRDEGDEDSIPPISIFYPSSSHPTITSLVGPSLPPNSIMDTAVVIVLDWAKPWDMIKELLTWLRWISEWAESGLTPGQAEEMRDRLQSHLQHYSEPAAPSSSTGASGSTTVPSSTYGNLGPLLPLGPGMLTSNPFGIPITVVCTKADLMDAAGDELGMKGAAWEERTDWIQQVLRTICLSYGASLFYTAPTQPATYTLLRTYLLHRLHTTPPPLHGDVPTQAQTSRFPFPHRANVLDRDAIMVPAGWDSWGKINVLRDGFDPASIGQALEESLPMDEQGNLSSLEELWERFLPPHEKGAITSKPNTTATTAEAEQSFLSRHLDALLKDPNRDPRQSFRHAAASASQSAAPPNMDGSMNEKKEESRYAGYGGVVGPMNSGGLSLPGVEKAMAEMEGAGPEDLKEKFARLGRRESTRAPNGGPLSPTTPTAAVPNEALHNFFQGLLATKAKSSTPSAKSSTIPEGKE